MRGTLIAIAAGLLIALLFSGGCTSKQMAAYLDKQAPDLAAKPSVPATQPGATTQPAVAANIPGQIAEVALHVTQDPSVAAAASTFPFGSVILGIAGIILTLVVGSAHKTASSADVIKAVAGVAGDVAPSLPAGPAKTIAQDAAAIGAVAGIAAAATPPKP